MKRKIIKIDESKCNGCGLCVKACHEGAIGMVDGKARLMRDDYCDGLGDCLPACPTNAIGFEEREAVAYDEAAVKANMAKNKTSGCPGTQARQIERIEKNVLKQNTVADLPCGCLGTHSKQISREETVSSKSSENVESKLSQWPVQIKLVPVNAPYFNGANLLVAADCSAFAYGNFHEKFIKNHIAIIGCPKLDMTDYAVKLTEIIKHNDIKSVKIVRMQVPCCGGLENAAKQAIMDSGKFLPWQVYTIATDGQIVE